MFTKKLKRLISRDGFGQGPMVAGRIEHTLQAFPHDRVVINQ
jgi:hypothetical protein